MPLLFLILVLFAYLLGSLSSAIILSKLMRLPDPRAQGSGNPGATNVLRLAGKKWGVVVLLGDVLKGVIAVVLAKWVGLSPNLIGWVALAVFMGHLYPVFFGFKGGKGVATGIGALWVLSWPLGLAVTATWLVVVMVSRYVSLASVVAALLAMVYGFWLVIPGNYLPLVLMCLLLVVRHRDNLRRLWLGKENKIGKKPADVA